MRSLLVACALLAFGLVFMSAPAPTEAQPRRGFGFGLSLGGPTGITFEFANRGRGFGQAFEATVGLDTFDEGGAYAHFLWKFYLADVARSGTLTVPIYTAIGPFIADGYRRRDDDDIDVGARMPFGIALDFNRVPLQVFFEIALLLEVVDDPDLFIDGAVGFRWFF